LSTTLVISREYPGVLALVMLFAVYIAAEDEIALSCAAQALRHVAAHFPETD